MKGRWIAENTVLAQEVIHKVRNHKNKGRLMIMKLDMMKAYDRLEWSFIDRALKA